MMGGEVLQHDGWRSTNMTDEYHNMMVDKDKQQEGRLRGNV
jgi:hypothetical protein